MNLQEGVILLDSLGDVQAGNTNPILVCGSHCGGNRELARHIGNCGVKAVFLNNAGVGKNNAGIRGLAHYEAENIIACAVDHFSAEIGVANETWESGIISHLNSRATAAGIQIGSTVKEAVTKIKSLTQQTASNNNSLIQEPVKKETNTALKKQVQVVVHDTSITVTDSITFLNENNLGDIVVCGSHGGISAGHYAQKHAVKAVFFNDAGIGKNNAGIKSLDFLSKAGILACTVDCMSAEIFNGKDVLENGIITVCNQQATDKNINENMTVKEAIQLLT